MVSVNVVTVKVTTVKYFFVVIRKNDLKAKLFKVHVRIMALPEIEKKVVDKKEKPLTKVIIRRLPPTIDQETFLKQVSPIPDYNYIYTVNGDFSLGENAFSRVYINFVNHEDVYNFKERFDNYVFLDAKGNEYPCVVEFASFQKIPKKRGKTRMDPKAGSIESDPYYLDFLENLKKPQELDEKPEYTLQLTTSTENKNDLTTPLLEYIKNKRAQRMRIRELRREERKRREFDKKRENYDDRKKISEEKSPTKKIHSKPEAAKNEKSDDVEEKSEKEERYYEKSYYKNKDRRYEDRKFDDRRKEPKPRFPRKEYPDYKSDNSKEKKYDYKKEYEPKTYPKKVKKYSEKREERKMEAQKAEQKKIDEAKSEEKKPEDAGNKNNDNNPKSSDKATPKVENVSKEEEEPEKSKPEEKSSSKDADKVDRDSKQRERDSESHNQRRIRNKDRPTIAIYRPGMLSKRKQTGEGDSNDGKEKFEEK